MFSNFCCTSFAHFNNSCFGHSGIPRVLNNNMFNARSFVQNCACLRELCALPLPKSEGTRGHCQSMMNFRLSEEIYYIRTIPNPQTTINKLLLVERSRKVYYHQISSMIYHNYSLLIYNYILVILLLS